jgi:hypothetical protein
MRDVLFEPQIAQNTQILISDIEVWKTEPAAAIHLPLQTFTQCIPWLKEWKAMI